MCGFLILILLVILGAVIIISMNGKKEKYTGCFDSGFAQLPGCYKDVDRMSSFGECSCGSTCTCAKSPAPCDSKDSECSFECLSGTTNCTLSDGSEGYCGLNSACFPMTMLACTEES
jgi:hypothetical protein